MKNKRLTFFGSIEERNFGVFERAEIHDDSPGQRSLLIFKDLARR